MYRPGLRTALPRALGLNALGWRGVLRFHKFLKIIFFTTPNYIICDCIVYSARFIFL